MSILRQRTQDAFEQLIRYGDEPANEAIVQVLEKLTDINDDLAHDRDPSLIREGIQEAKRLLDSVYPLT